MRWSTSFLAFDFKTCVFAMNHIILWLHFRENEIETDEADDV